MSAVYEHLLVATDGSEPASRAVEDALDVAERHDATVHVLHVVDTGRYDESALSSAELVVDDLEDEGWALVDEVAASASDRGLDAVTTVCHGRPADEILAYADGHDVDLVVLGYTGESHKRTATIGHVSERVVQQAHRPVLVV
ncbi:universal stress protein [Haloarchaeobius sp. HRN-SO-5]|uniref:universal stress protein n=1 Tax=Haloarchaeobius sp. HRN-SO-5 TaxID=3446118 RepID=UPI003EB75A68